MIRARSKGKVRWGGPLENLSSERERIKIITTIIKHRIRGSLGEMSRRGNKIRDDM